LFYIQSLIVIEFDKEEQAKEFTSDGEYEEIQPKEDDYDTYFDSYNDAEL
jgi:uncharacterized protein (DUF1330 family)